jgi:hypothetical protein
VARLTAAASFAVPQHAACPFVLPDGAPREGLGAAAVAASAQGPGLRAQPVREAFQVLATWADAVVVAGIGGWLTPPVAPGAPATGPLLASMCQRLHLPLLLCTRLDAEAPERARRAMKLAGLRPVAWLAVPSTPGDADDATGAAAPATADDAVRIAQLEAIFHAPCVGRLPGATDAAQSAHAPGDGIALAPLLARLLGPAAGSPPDAPAALAAAPDVPDVPDGPSPSSQITQDAAPRAGR